MLKQTEPTDRPMSDYERIMAKAQAAGGYSPTQRRRQDWQEYAFKPYRPSPLEEMEKQQTQASEDLNRLTVGIVFLRDNPQINEFIRLIRIGAISI